MRTVSAPHFRGDSFALNPRARILDSRRRRRRRRRRCRRFFFAILRSSLRDARHVIALRRSWNG